MDFFVYVQQLYAWMLNNSWQDKGAYRWGNGMAPVLWPVASLLMTGPVKAGMRNWKVPGCRQCLCPLSWPPGEDSVKNLSCLQPGDLPSLRVPWIWELHFPCSIMSSKFISSQVSHLTMKMFLSACGRPEPWLGSSVSEQQHYRRPVLKGLSKKGSPLNQKTSFCTCSQMIFLPTWAVSSRRDGLGQPVAVDINACFMQNKNVILVTFKEFWHCMYIFVEIITGFNIFQSGFCKIQIKPI